MLALIVTLLRAIGALGFGLILLRRWLKDEDILTQWGVGGIAGLGILGTVTFVVGLLPKGIILAASLSHAICLIGLVQFCRTTNFASLRPKLPTGPFLVLPIALVVFALLGLMGVLAPSTSLDWDSLAYHLAAPKVWLAAQQITFISYDHHSNFPLAVDALYILGLKWGGEVGAKAFSWAFYLFGMLAMFGLARKSFGEKAGWWASLAFASMPVMLWESGTAYIDLANGLFLGLGIWFSARFVATEDRNQLWLAALMLGLGVGSKYTGLQVFGIAGLVLLVGAIRSKKGNVGPVLVAGLVGLLIGCPAYIRNVVNTGNPVYPFLYSKLGGKNWDVFSEKIYSEEQNSFGVGRPASKEGSVERLDPLRVGHSILGLSYQPGRYTNPLQTSGGGFPFQALGFGVIFSFLAGWIGLKTLKDAEQRAVALSALIIVTGSLLVWCVLSQQSRYIAGLFVPIALIGAALIAQIKTVRTATAGSAVAAAICIQAMVTLFVHHTYVSTGQMKVVLGSVSEDDYRQANIGFARGSKILNEEIKPKKVALYNEVFGFLLDVPYFWANPGHTTEIGYEQLKDGKGLAESLKRLGISHAYVNLSPSIEPAGERMVQAMGLGGTPVPYTPEEVADLNSDLRKKWKWLIVDAVLSGAFKPVKPVGRAIIFEIP